MPDKYNPIRVCSCFACRQGPKRSEYLHQANRKFRHLSNQQLRQLLGDGNLDEEDELSEGYDVERIFVDGGYTD